MYGAAIVSGADFVLDAVGFDDEMPTADLVVVGEGRLDGQTFTGKIMSRILARAHSVPVHAIVGSLGPGADAMSSRLAAATVASTLEELTAAGPDLALNQTATPPLGDHQASG